MFEKHLQKAKAALNSAISTAANGDARIAAEKAVKGAKEKVSQAAADAAGKLGQSYVHSGRWIPANTIEERLPEPGQEVLVYGHEVGIDDNGQMKIVPRTKIAKYVSDRWQVRDDGQDEVFHIHMWTTLPPECKPDEEMYQAMLKADLMGQQTDAAPESAESSNEQGIDIPEAADYAETDPAEEGENRGFTVSKWDVILRNVQTDADARALVAQLRNEFDTDPSSPAGWFVEECLLTACVLYTVDICDNEDRHISTVKNLVNFADHDSDSSSRRLERSDLEKLFAGLGEIENGQFVKKYDSEAQKILKKQIEEESMAGIYYRAFKLSAPEETGKAILTAKLRMQKFAEPWA